MKKGEQIRGRKGGAKSERNRNKVNKEEGNSNKTDKMTKERE